MPKFHRTLLLIIKVVLVVFGGLVQCWYNEGSDFYTSQPFSYQYVHRKYDIFFEHEGSRWLCLVFGICSTVSPGTWASGKPGMAPVFQWSQLEFDFPSPSARQSSIDSGDFIPGVPAPIDVDVYYSPDKNAAHNRIFVSIPRFQAGVPATFGTVSDQKIQNNPVIVPYPSWDWHNNPKSCASERIVSVYRALIDECDRLWVLDTGKVLDDQVCPAQILAFDLNTNQLLHKYEIPSSQLESRSILVTPMVDVRDAHLKCRDTFVYIADCQTYSIIVYDLRRDTSWRITDKTMYPYPNYGTFSIQGDSFDLMDGILGMSLEPYQPGQDRKLYYHAMSSPTENWVYTSDLRNQSRFIHDPTSSPEIFHVVQGRRNTQSAAEAMDRNGIMYFGLMTSVTLDCWNPHSNEYGPANIEVIADNTKTLQFASGVKVITNQHGVQELWVMTSRFQKVATGTLRSSEVNFRILAGKTDDLIFGTRCKREGGGGHHNKRPGGNNNGGGYGLLRP